MTRLIVTNDGGSATRVRAGQHSLSADEPKPLEGPLDDIQRAKLAAIAERCPVNLTLRREVLMEQRLAGGRG